MRQENVSLTKMRDVLEVLEEVFCVGTIPEGVGLNTVVEEPRRKGRTKQEMEEMMINRGVGERVRERVLRLNEFPLPCGFYIRGVQHKHTTRNMSILMDGMQIKDFIEKYGREKYHQLPKEAFMRKGHRKLIRFEWMQDKC